MRQMSTQYAVLDAESIVRAAGGSVLELRGFRYLDTMAYRLVVQDAQGRISTMIVDARDGAIVPEATPLALSVAETSGAASSSRHY